MGYQLSFKKCSGLPLGKILVECFSESFAKGEMSSSQSQAVITLIEKKRPGSLRPKKLEANFTFKC